VLASGCVTRFERFSPHERIPKDESVWDELRREFGWKKQEKIYKSTESSEPFYKKTIQGVATTVSGWFSDDDKRLSEEEIAANRLRFDRKRAEALQKLREQQDLEQNSHVEEVE